MVLYRCCSAAVGRVWGMDTNTVAIHMGGTGWHQGLTREVSFIMGFLVLELQQRKEAGWLGSRL